MLFFSGPILFIVPWIYSWIWGNVLENVASSSNFHQYQESEKGNLIIFTSGAPNGNFRENICSEDDLRTRIFGTFVVKFLACLPLQGFSNIYKMV